MRRNADSGKEKMNKVNERERARFLQMELSELLLCSQWFKGTRWTLIGK